VSLPWNYKKPCDKPFKSNVKGYCEEHGCRVCDYVNLKWKYQNHSSDEKLKDIKLRLELGEESVCSLECKAKADTKYFWEETRNLGKRQQQAKLIVEITRLNRETDILVKNILPLFYNIISGTRIIDLKLQLIKEEINKQEFINKVHTCIDNLSLESAEKKQWKEIYSESSLVEDLLLLSNKERQVLLSLVKKKKREEQEKQEIVKEINTELGYFSPQVDLKELPATYHNFTSLKTLELRKGKSKIIEAIKNKREEKKLLAFLDKGASCADNELLSFIQSLENIASVHASQYEKSAYYSQKQKVDSLLNRLQKRWNNLNEEAKLNHCLNSALSNFDSWLKEGENLVLSDTCPFRNFKEDIEKLRSESEIENMQRQAFQHTLEKFKKDVKNQLGAEEWDNEYQEIDNGKTFPEIKLARDKVRQDREKSLEEFIERAINKLQSLLDSNQEVNLSEIILPTWKEDLRGLSNKSEVSAVAKKMEEEISDAASHAKKYKNQEESGPNSNGWFFTHWKIAVVIIGLGFCLGTFFVIKLKTKKNLSN